MRAPKFELYLILPPRASRGAAPPSYRLTTGTTEALSEIRGTRLPGTTCGDITGQISFDTVGTLKLRLLGNYLKLYKNA